MGRFGLPGMADLDMSKETLAVYYINKKGIRVIVWNSAQRGD